jgi:hypothetical protein
MSIKVYDDFLDSQEFSELNSLVESSDFPWYFNRHITHHTEERTFGQFTHTLYRVNEGVISKFSPKIMGSLIPQIENVHAGSDVIVVSSKMNLNVMRDDHFPIGTFHVDRVIPGGIHKTAIFYLNTNDGFTKFETGKIVKSEANRIAIFDGNINHHGYTCTDAQTRIILNLNYLVLP